MSSFVKTLALLALVPTADHSAKRGFLVNFSAGGAALNASATVPAMGVIVDGETVNGYDAVAVIGGNCGTVRVKLGGTVAQGALLIQKNDGTALTDPGTGARVIFGRALEGGASGELVECVLLTPTVFTS